MQLSFGFAATFSSKPAKIESSSSSKESWFTNTQILEYSETHEKGSIFSKVQSRGVGFRFIAILEEAFGCNLRDDNPWMNAESKQKTFKMKRVRFTPLEVFDKTLPNCQISGENKSPGCLHAVSCPNNAFETFDVIGQHAWQNRQMLLKFISDKEEPSI